MNQTLEEKIINRIKDFYGERYYGEYHPNPVKGDEFSKLYNLIIGCVDLVKAGE